MNQVVRLSASTQEELELLLWIKANKQVAAKQISAFFAPEIADNPDKLTKLKALAHCEHRASILRLELHGAEISQKPAIAPTANLDEIL